MATWEEINQEIARDGLDPVRRRKIQAFSALTHRPTIVYAVEMFDTEKINQARGDTALNLSDKDSFKEALRGINGQELDIILHSPGGSPEATESLVDLLRRRFNSIRFIIPSIAKSAATMLAMSGNEIILGMDAELGPTDPQMVLNEKISPANAILDQFEYAKKDLSGSSNNLPAWLPILQQYGPSLLTQCQNAIKLSKELVTKWLGDYMFGSHSRANMQKAALVGRYLADKKHLSHSRSVDITYLKSKGVNIKYTSELTPDLTEALEDIHLAVMQTFLMTGTYKIFENSLGKGFYKKVERILIQMPQFPQGTPPQSPTPPQQIQTPVRTARRRNT